MYYESLGFQIYFFLEKIQTYLTSEFEDYENSF